MQRIFFINRYFWPDHSATSQILSQLAFHLAKSTRNVQVITSRQLYDNPTAHLPAREILPNLTIDRVSGTHFGRSDLPSRTIDYLSFYAGAFRLLSTMADRGDILIPMTDPPLLSILGMRIARRRGSYLVNWLQDIYPEIATELAVPLVKGPLRHLLSYARNASLRNADANIVVGERMAEKVSSLGVQSDRITVIPNWSDDERITPIDAADNPLRRQWQLEGKFIIGYSGNLGRAHEFDTLLAAAKQLSSDTRILFLFIGSGHRSDELEQQVNAHGLAEKFVFKPYQTNDTLKYSLSVPDVHWVSLRPELEGLIVPSKFYGIAAVGRPIIAVTAKTGEIARLVEAYDCGAVIAPGDADALAKVIMRFSNNPEETAATGRRARAMLEAQFTRGHAFQRWDAVIDRIFGLEPRKT